MSTSPEELLRTSVLAQFACPFSKTESGCLLSATTGCSLGHDASGHLMTIPSYICVSYLMRHPCGPVESLSGLERCTFGFHPKMYDLASLELYRRKLDYILLSPIPSKTGQSIAAPAVLPNSQVTPNGDVEAEDEEMAEEEVNANPQCGICLEQFSLTGQIYGMLESCTHVFCGTCLATWREQDASQLRCPVCRDPSKRILIWSQAITSAEEKKRILDLQGRCTPVDDEPTSDDSDEEEGEETDQPLVEGTGAGGTVRTGTVNAQARIIIDQTAVTELVRNISDMFGLRRDPPPVPTPTLQPSQVAREDDSVDVD